LIIIMIGTLGYVIIERWSILESLYMTVITLSTIGFGEVKPMTDVGRLFTLFIIIFGVGNAAYLIGQMTRVLVEGSLQNVIGRRKVEHQIKKLSNHYILCGHGRIGRLIANEIESRHLPLVVIEANPEEIEDMAQNGRLCVRGDASEEENLIKAGITRAAGLIAAVQTDADNLFIILTARSLKEDLYVLSRANEEKSIKKLLGAGADEVISPYLIGARKMAQSLLRPTVSDFIETTVHGGSGINLAMEEILVTPDSRLKDVTLLDSNIRRDLDLIIIAIKTAAGDMIFNPAATQKIQVGDTLIAVGQRQNMERLEQILGAETSLAPTYPRRRARRKAGDGG
jgi:voltage-gated potassium channel